MIRTSRSLINKTQKQFPRLLFPQNQDPLTEIYKTQKLLIQFPLIQKNMFISKRKKKPLLILATNKHLKLPLI